MPASRSLALWFVMLLAVAVGLYGLPRVVSTADDVRFIFNAVDSAANGLTLCAGSFGTRADNDIVAMVEEFGPRMHFTHLRNVTREATYRVIQPNNVYSDGAPTLEAFSYGGARWQVGFSWQY